MDLRRLQHFVVLAETLNFRHAAERLHMTQPPLSVSIQKLEADLGCALFTRTPQGVKLTASGEIALVEARRTLLHAGKFRDIARATASGEIGKLSIGFVGSATHAILPKALPVFRKRYPGVELVLRESTSIRIMQLLEEEALDIGLIRVPVQEVQAVRLEPLETDVFVAALPSDHPLASRASLDLSELAQEAFIAYSAEEAPGLYMACMMACQLSGFTPRVTQVAVQISTVLSLVESGLGIALVPSVSRRFSSDQIVYRTLDNLPSSTSIGISLAFRPDAENVRVRAFRELVTREFRGNGEA
jgi:DNA-binding transcriptional LysR family regulator